MTIPTLQELQTRTYGRFPEVAQKPDRCVERIRGEDRWPSWHQCRNKRGYGPHAMFCKIHARRYAEPVDTAFCVSEFGVREVQVKRVTADHVYTDYGRLRKAVVFKTKPEAIRAYLDRLRNRRDGVDAQIAQLEKELEGMTG